MSPSRLVLVTLIALACATDGRDYTRAAEQNTVDAYRDFLERHPTSPLAEDARRDLEKLEFQSAQSPGELQQFIDRHPDSPFAGRARLRLDQLELDATHSRGDVDAFLARRPGTSLRGEAIRRRDAFAIEDAIRKLSAGGSSAAITSKLVADGIDLNQGGDGGRTLATVLVGSGDVEGVRLLARHGADLSDGRYLTDAVRKGDGAMAGALVDGATKEARRSALYEAARAAQWDMVRLLKKHGATTPATDSRSMFLQQGGSSKLLMGDSDMRKTTEERCAAAVRKSAGARTTVLLVDFQTSIEASVDRSGVIRGMPVTKDVLYFLASQGSEQPARTSAARCFDEFGGRGEPDVLLCEPASRATCIPAGS